MNQTYTSSYLAKLVARMPHGATMKILADAGVKPVLSTTGPKGTKRFMWGQNAINVLKEWRAAKDAVINGDKLARLVKKAEKQAAELRVIPPAPAQPDYASYLASIDARLSTMETTLQELLAAYTAPKAPEPMLLNGLSMATHPLVAGNGSIPLDD